MVVKGWREIPIGGLITDAGNSVEYETGSWRSLRPIWDEGKCNNCQVCWVYCPDGAVQVEDEVVVGIDLAHCKGCGICAQECPQGAITMIEEALALAEERE